MSKNAIEYKQVKISDLHPAAYNPRVELKPGDGDFDRLEGSIKEFGNVEPILLNKRTGNVIGGHQRLAVLRHMGETETTAGVVDMDIEEEKLLNIALNKIKGGWDYDKLGELMSQFEPTETAMSGFTAAEVAILVAKRGFRSYRRF